jgi:hypothetical protein
MDRLRALCVSDGCRRAAEGTSKLLDRLTVVELMAGPYTVAIGATGYRKPDDPRLADRIRLFPKGTEFKLVLKYRDTPVVQRLERTLHDLFVAEGMTLQIESPAPAGR